MLKRGFDLAVATAGLVIFAPILLIAALLVKLDSSGPVMYQGQRVGKDGRVFRIYKIRTLVADAKLRGPRLVAADDPRITRVGRVLRRTRLDELPQLFNVLKGEMSLVGPAPEDSAYVSLYTPEQRQTLTVRPGMTSPAALAFSDEERILAASPGDATYTSSILPVKLDLDLAYVRRRSFWYDLALLGQTIGLAFPRQFVLFRRLSSWARRGTAWGVVDAPVVALGFYLAVLLRFLDAPPGELRSGLTLLNAAILPLIVLYVGVNYLFRLDRRAWHYATVLEVTPIWLATATSTVVAVLVDLALGGRHLRPLPLSVILLGGAFTFIGFVAVRYGWRLLGRASRWTGGGAKEPMRALIYGAGEAGQLLAWRLVTRKEGRPYQIVGFIDDDRKKRGLRIHGLEVLGNRSDLASLVDRERVELIILAMSNISGEKLRAIVSIAQETPAQIKVAPGMFDWIARPNGLPIVREVRVEDLLGRPPVSVDRPACQGALGNKVVMVTGACGSIGSELCRRIAAFAPQRLVAVDNNETGVYDLEIELRNTFPALPLAAAVGDVTNERRMEALFGEMQPEVIFHVAAYKHVPLMEQHPEEAVRVNIQGTAIALAKARQVGAERFVLVSTDKAVNPSSVMGATKRIAEMLVMSDIGGADAGQATGGLLCTAVRFGNVLGSRGSVIPTFARQIELGGPVTVTHPEMTRYFMEISEAASLILQAATFTRGRDIFMLDMGERIRIDDLARKMIRMRGLRPDIDIAIVYTGVRPGEKLHEELTHAEEEKEATTHPLIQRVLGLATPGRQALLEEVEKLLRLGAAGKREQLVEELLQFAYRGDREGVTPR